MSNEYWEISLPEVLEESGINLAGVDVPALCRRVAEIAELESDYHASVNSARIGPLEYERGVAHGRESAMQEVYAALGNRLELVRGRDGLRVQMASDLAWAGQAHVKVE